jgi:hypothetical protein
MSATNTFLNKTVFSNNQLKQLALLMLIVDSIPSDGSLEPHNLGG